MGLVVVDGIGYETETRSRGHTFELIDIKRVGVRAKATPDAYAELPKEGAVSGMLGHLKKPMCATRGASHSVGGVLQGSAYGIYIHTGKGINLRLLPCREARPSGDTWG